MIDGAYGTMEQRIRALRKPSGRGLRQLREVRAYDLHPRREWTWPQVAKAAAKLKDAQ